MVSRIDDRWLWLGFGVFFFIAAKGIRYAIQDTIRLTRLDSHESESKNQKTKEEQPEETISLENLRILAESPHPNIANAAISVIVSRFSKLPHAAHMLKKDNNSRDQATRDRVYTLIKFLQDYELPTEMRRRILPIPSAVDDEGTESPFVTTPVLERAELTTAELSRRLADGVGGVAGGDGLGEGDGVVAPSPQNPVAGWTSVPRERPVDDGAEEAETRRRRREVMVLHEGVGRVGEEDIIRPR